MIPRPLARVPLAAFLVLSVAHLVVKLSDTGVGDRATQVLLMPALALVVLTATDRPRPRLVALLLFSLFFSWLGDSLPALAEDDTAFLLMVGGFLVAQAVLVFAFWPHRTESVLYRRRWLLVPYAGYVAVLVWLCAPNAGALLVPILVYGLVLGAMAVLSTGINAWTWAGGALFLLSDGLIALRAFAPGFDPPQGDFWVMITYITAQALIAVGVLRHEAPAPADRP